MTILCNDNTYVIYYTDSRKGTISVSKRSLLTNVLDVALVGKNRLNYGEAFDENMLHMLENFAVPENASFPGNPDLTQTFGTTLQNPTEGQLWYNTTKKRLYILNKFDIWLPIGNNDDVGGSSGTIAHGATIPLPVSAITGSSFSYAECSWNVSPWYFPGQIDYMECFTDSNGVVSAQYKLHGSDTLTPGFANYQIIGIRNNINHGFNTPIGPSGTLPATPTSTPTPTPSRTATTPTPTPTVTPTISITPTQTPTPTPSPGIEYYLFSSFNPGSSIGNIGYGAATATGFANSSTIATSDYMKGQLVSDGVNIFAPFYNNGLTIYQRTSGALTLTHTISLDSGFKLLNVALSGTGSSYKFVTVLQDASVPANVKVVIYNATVSGASFVATRLGEIDLVNNGYNNGTSIDYSSSVCFHKGYIFAMTTPGTIFAYNTSGTLLDSFILTAGHNAGITSDGTYMYVQTGYDNIGAKNPRYILTFNTNSLKIATALILNGDGDLGVTFGSGFLFTGFNGAEIIARTWDGIALSPAIAQVPFEVPTYGYHFVYSTTNGRLYNPLDFNLVDSKAYSWNGATFTSLYSFRPESDVSKQICALTLGYVIDSTMAP